MGHHVCPEDCQLHKVCIGSSCQCRKQGGRPTSCYPCRLAKTACRPGLGGEGMCERCLKKGSPHYCNRRGGEGAQGEGVPAGRHGPQYPVDFGPDAGAAILNGGMGPPSPIFLGQQPTPPGSPTPALVPGSVSSPMAPAFTPAPFRPRTPAFTPPVFPRPPVTPPALVSAQPPVLPSPLVPPRVPTFSPAAFLTPAALLPPAFAPSAPAPISSDHIFTPFGPAPAPARECNCLSKLTEAKEAIDHQSPENNPDVLVAGVLLAERELANALDQFASCAHCFGRYRWSCSHIIEICGTIEKGAKALWGYVLPVAPWLKPEENGETLQLLIVFIAFLQHFGELDPAVQLIGTLNGALERVMSITACGQP
ncbi:hypothetical protein QBC45DRAFT_474544 [Copromyces sp. CBS 386.78]|nr:hypothetical protein QBC45DRAFT_474544 [Copromyces sp. CBS 386.78]